MSQLAVIEDWRSLPTETRTEIFRMVSGRVAEIVSIRDLKHIGPSPLDRWLPVVIQRMETYLVPAGDAVAAEAVEYVCQLMNCKRPTGAVLEGYKVILGKVPRDLLLPAIAEAVANERFHVLPTPGALIHFAREKWIQRQELLVRARQALSKLDLARKLNPASFPKAAPA